MAQNNNNTGIKETMSLQEKECSLCGGTDEVGLNGCDCEDVLICKHCDIDGVNYDGWCKCGDCDTDIIQWNSDATNSDVCFICDKENEGHPDEDNICPDCDEKWQYDEEKDAYIPTYNTQTNPPYCCDGGCGTIVGEGWDHDCERVCPDCKKVD